MEELKMGVYNKFGSKSLKERSDEENARAAADRNKANIDYIAMMCDVEIPTENEEVRDEQEI